MAKIIKFAPKRELSARQNLKAFIALARNDLIIWSDLPGFDWEASNWPTTHKNIRFTNFEHRDLNAYATLETDKLMKPAFAELAKAYLRHKHSLRPNKAISRDINAFRVIEFALRQDMVEPDITKFCQRHWDLLVKALEPIATRQLICNIALSILKKLAEYLILGVDPRFWRHPYVGRQGYDAINGALATDENKAKKVPDQDALLAIAEVFSLGSSETQEDIDVMVTCVTGLLLSAPMRIGETIRFRTSCIQHDNDKNGVRQHYLSYWVPKTQEFARKPIPKTMFEITTTAIQRLTKITEEGRALALYLETNPSKFYRHANCPNVLDDQELTSDQVVQALGYNGRNSCQDFIQRHTGSMSLKGFTLDTLWQIVLSENREINPNFPYQEALESSTTPPLKMSESLLCFRRSQLSPRYNTSPVLLSVFDGDVYRKRLTTGSERAESMNFFARNGYKALKFKPHSVRHLLNRLARNSGINLEFLTEWSNRATTRQTLTYIHDNPAKAAKNGAILFETIQEQEPKQPVTTEEAALYGQGPFHRSRYGICRRSWRAGPCNKFADCLNCSELLMCKGDKLAAEIIKTDRDSLVQTYTAAQQAITRGERAASRWTEKAAPQIERLDQLLTIFNDPSIPDGSPIEMTGEDFSHEKVITSEKAKAAGIRLLNREQIGISYGDDLLACLELLWNPDNV